MSTLRNKIWTVTATDSSGGAGAFADIKVAHTLGCDCGMIVIALTAQNSLGVQAVQPITLNDIHAQWHALEQDGWPEVIRLGWLPAQVDILEWLVTKLQEYSGIVIWDPVLSASQGSALSQDWQEPTLKRLQQQLLQRADLITPNIKEARTLANLADSASAKDCAQSLSRQGARHLLVTGEQVDDGYIDDLFLFSHQSKAGQEELPGDSLATMFTLRKPALDAQAHGTGCHLAASVACLLAKKHSLYDAITQAVGATTVALKNASLGSKGVGNAWASHYVHAKTEDWPLVYAEPKLEGGFASLDGPLGLYGLVDNLAHLQRLLELGINTLQWRVKAPSAGYIKDTQQAIALCNAANVPLFINDDWKLAIKLNAYGVHLGQEDLALADLPAIQAAGLRLGISTHGDWELARARALQPSYIAIGPIYKPLSKELKYAPQGLKKLARFVSCFPDTQFTCIGGITQENAHRVWATGVQSIAIVTDLANDEGLEERIQKLRAISSENTLEIL